jgi:uncharacterized protein (TIGR02266 family)
MTPEDFATLTKEAMFAELRRLGIVHGQGNSEEQLVTYYREWYATLTEDAEGPPEPATPAKPVNEAERRRAHRAQINVEIGLRTETNFFVGFSGDISEGGILITTVALLPIGTAVKLTFSFPGGLEVEAEGDVAWTREGVAFDSDLEPGMGIRFTHLSDAALAAIQEFASIREPIFYAD